MNKCILCGNATNKEVFNELGIIILRCQNCGHVFSSFKADQYYDGYFGNEKITEDDDFFWNEAHRVMYNEFCKRFIVNKKGRIFDVGCGLGYFLKVMSKYPEWDVYGYDISRIAVDFAKNNLKLKNVFHGNVEESDFPKNYFDIITLWDVIEHIPDPDPILSYLSQVLKEDGFLFIHTPNINIQLPKARIKRYLYGLREGISYLEAKDHINIYSQKTIKVILKRNGFSIIEFTHLKPIQSVAGSNNTILNFIKNLWSLYAKLISKLTFKKVNIDNLFVIAKKWD
jgi:2-polyprenyl-3-methyl-5-hydroxy-6-metoxy-1,4-benzoquinol methylase